MTSPQSASSEERLPPSRIVRWVLLAGVILFSVGLYFRFGLHVPPIGTVPPPASTTP
ncbi:MAG TPA: hypothetical protein VK573_11435 [Gemmatimonadales bacterium]|nr:hypothetical protein [Gemmatimonadales bacterium]